MPAIVDAVPQNLAKALAFLRPEISNIPPKNIAILLLVGNQIGGMCLPTALKCTGCLSKGLMDPLKVLVTP